MHLWIQDFGKGGRKGGCHLPISDKVYGICLFLLSSEQPMGEGGRNFPPGSASGLVYTAYFHYTKLNDKWLSLSDCKICSPSKLS